MNKSNVFFWNVDTQFDFMSPDGALSVPDAQAIIPTLERITRWADENKVTVVSTADYHYEDSEELSDKPDFVQTFPEHCMADSDGVDFIPETAPKDAMLISWENFYTEFDMSKREFVVTKDAFDVFVGNPNMDDFLETLYDERGCDTVCVYGVAGNVCVKYAVEGLREREFKVILLTDAIKNLPNIPDPTQSEMWMEDESLRMMTFDQFLAELR